MQVWSRNRRTGGVDWIGRQVVDNYTGTAVGAYLEEKRPPSVGSSEESFAHLAGAEAEASILLEEYDDEEVEGVGHVHCEGLPGEMAEAQIVKEYMDRIGDSRQPL
jgi:hypothetical protein